MFKFISRRTLVLLLCVLLLSNQTQARADTLQSNAHAIVGGAIAIAAAIGVVVVVLVVHSRPATVKGCVTSGPNGLQLTDSADKLTYELSGTTSDLKSGELMQVKGKKKKGKHGAASTFAVTQLSKDYGACPANPNP